MSKLKGKRFWESTSGVDLDAELQGIDDDLFDNANSIGAKIKEDFKDAVNTKTGKRIESVPVDLLEDAPASWNRGYRDIEEDKWLFKEIVETLLLDGLYEPISIWKKPEGEGYYILAGHSRTKIFRYLRGLGKEGFDAIPAIIYEHKDLTQAAAIRILLNTNRLRRRDNSQYKQIIEQGLDIIATEEEMQPELAKPENAGKRLRDLVGEKLGISSRDVYNYKKLYEMPDSVLKLVDETPVTKTFLIQHCLNNKEMQDFIYQHKDIITKDKIKMIKNTTSPEDIRHIFLTGKEKPIPTKIVLEVQEQHAQEVVDKIIDLLANIGVADYNMTVNNPKKKKTTS